MRYRISAEAERDLQEIYDYISQDNPDAAAATIEDLLQTFDRLTLYPRLGHTGREPGTREFMHAPYLIVYGIDDDTILIYTVIHGGRLYL